MEKRTASSGSPAAIALNLPFGENEHEEEKQDQEKGEKRGGEETRRAEEEEEGRRRVGRRGQATEP